jgi:hypothetical protein
MATTVLISWINPDLTIIFDLKDFYKGRDTGWTFFIAAGTLYITTTHLIFVSPEEKVSTSALHFRFSRVVSLPLPYLLPLFHFKR